MVTFIFQSTAIKCTRFYRFYCSSGPAPHPHLESNLLFLRMKPPRCYVKRPSGSWGVGYVVWRKGNCKLPDVSAFSFCSKMTVSLKWERFLSTTLFLPQASQVPNLGAKSFYSLKLVYIKMVMSSTASFRPKSHLKDTPSKEPERTSFIASKYSYTYIYSQPSQ